MLIRPHILLLQPDTGHSMNGCVEHHWDENMHATTIVCVRRGGQVALGGDGQVTLGDHVMKGNARKVRRLYRDRVLAGFAGGTADAFTLFERFEAKLEEHGGQLTRAAVELAKDWRTDRMLRRLGSGGPYARAAAQALLRDTELDAPTICDRALEIAGDICIYTNHHRTIETLGE